MNESVDFALMAFTSLFSMLNPVGLIPVFISLTSGLSQKEARKVALKATTTAFLILVTFALLGKFIFDFFHISVNGLKIVGGVIFFITGYDMLQAHISRIKESSDEGLNQNLEYANDIAITPIAIPMLCGPGAITLSIVLMSEAGTVSNKIILISMLILILLIDFISFISGRKIMSFIGDNGNKVMMRIMGLIIMVISVELFFSGLKPIVQDILKL